MTKKVSEQPKNSRHEIIMAGLGGMGVLSAGQILSRAAFQTYKHVSYAPTYGFAMRGGLCQCTVIFSDERIASPLLDQAQAVMLLDSSQFSALEPRVRPGGIIIADSAGLCAERERNDYKLYALPAVQTAVSMGTSLVRNFILLGFYVAILGTVSSEIIEAEIQRRYSNNVKMLGRNLEAFKRGLELGKGAT
jgi:2-oxoglutarate ferredoxin oxidoreductase subunit gamma